MKPKPKKQKKQAGLPDLERMIVARGDRLECLRIAENVQRNLGNNDPEKIIEVANKFYQFIRKSEENIEKSFLMCFATSAVLISEKINLYLFNISKNTSKLAIIIPNPHHKLTNI